MHAAVSNLVHWQRWHANRRLLLLTDFLFWYAYVSRLNIGQKAKNCGPRSLINSVLLNRFTCLNYSLGKVVTFGALAIMSIILANSGARGVELSLVGVGNRLLIPTCNFLLKIREHGPAASLAKLLCWNSETPRIHCRERSRRVLVNRLGPLITSCNLWEEAYRSVLCRSKLSRGSILSGSPWLSLLFSAVFGWLQSEFTSWLGNSIFVLVYVVTIFSTRNVLWFLFDHILPHLWVGIMW